MKKDISIGLVTEIRINKLLDRLQKDSRIDVFREIKTILNTSFGEENNQIVKLEAPDVVNYMAEFMGTGAYTSIPGDDYIAEKLCNAGYMILIKFPEITIKNSDGKSNLLKDMFVRVFVDKNGKFTHGIDATRTTLTQAELTAGYIHSHISSRAVNPVVKFDRFCLGQGEIVHSVLNWKKEFTPINFTIFCLHLKAYVAWESLEGSPYIRMSSVRRSTANLNALNLNNLTVDTIVDMLYPSVMSMENIKIKSLFNYSMTKSEFIVSSTEALESFLAKQIQGWNYRAFPAGTNQNMLLTCKDNAGNYYSTFAANTTRPEQKDPILLFKQEYQFLKIINSTNEIKSNLYAHPQITQELCRRISYRITKTAFGLDRNSIGKDTSDPVRKTSEANNTSML